MQRYEIKTNRDAQDPVITFHGEMIGCSSSWEDGKVRWQEINIYRTDTGAYVIEKLGRSRLVHRPNAKCSTREPGAQPRYWHVGDIGCRSCKPNEAAMVLGEVTYRSAAVARSPRGVIAALESYDDNEVRKMTIVAAEALEDAGTRDPQLAEARKVVQL